MCWDRDINREDRPTAVVYSLRKEGRIEDAYNQALNLYNQDSTDDDIKKAFAWTLIDLCKKYISENNLNQAQIFFKQLSDLDFEYEDDFVDTIKKQIKFLKPKIDIYYAQIQRAGELSKSGQNKQALELIHSMIANNQLSELNHETYGWVIYRYIKAEENNISSIEIRTLLRDYMNLKNERPSLLHSMILNFALNYSKNHPDFNLYNFFVLWNPQNLRYEDLHESQKEGQKISSLISRICAEFMRKDTGKIKDVLNIIPLEKAQIIDLFREPYFWLLFNAHKENRFSDLWSLFDKYNVLYAEYGKSKWHSEILKLAERFMKENESWRFLAFFKQWNPDNFMDSDWKEELGKDGEKYKPLAIKTIKKVFDVIQNQQNNNEADFLWLITAYDKAVKLFPTDEWIFREKALLHIKNQDLDSAIKIYRELVLDLGDKHYIWHEFSTCLSDKNLKIGMLSKALEMQKQEDFLGDIHLDLARLLIEENIFENAFFELQAYKNHRESKSWKLSALYEELKSKINISNSNIKTNRDLYKKYIPLAESFAYQDIDWTEVVLVDRWKNEDKKEKLAFTDGKSIDFSVGINRFTRLEHPEQGQIYKFKLHKQEIKKEIESKDIWKRKTIVTEYKYIPLIVEKSDKKDWSILPTQYGYIEYINIEKKMLHIITNESNPAFYQYNKESFTQGDFVVFNQYEKRIKDEKRICVTNIKKCDSPTAIQNFKNRIVVVDDVNESKRLYHYVLGKKLLTGIAFFDRTNIHPAVGDFLKVYYCVKKDKENKKKLETLCVEKTEEQNDELRKTISGRLELKYKSDSWQGKADFAFINDYYVSKSILQKFNIIEDCNVRAQAVYTGDGDKWKVFDIEML
ncbi:hypothetical protein EZS27_021679 [termite gut metagenome]|uniref:TOTE conflict systems S1/CSD-like domain-containing protein n=1 Tax=termite gut metagenome TaxID=433724 RepID=A0A5J4R8W1_9ZZZZ